MTIVRGKADRIAKMSDNQRVPRVYYLAYLGPTVDRCLICTNLESNRAMGLGQTLLRGTVE